MARCLPLRPPVHHSPLWCPCRLSDARSSCFEPLKSKSFNNHAQSSNKALTFRACSIRFVQGRQGYFSNVLPWLAPQRLDLLEFFDALLQSHEVAGPSQI